MTFRAIIPNTQVAGKTFTSVGDGTDLGVWGGASYPTITRTYAITGPIDVASGAQNYIPSFPVKLLNGETMYLVGICAYTRSASLTMDFYHNVGTISGLTGINVTSGGPGYVAAPSPVLVADGDEFSPVVTAISGAPDGLSVSFVFSVVI